jgi:hypothetical protein
VRRLVFNIPELKLNVGGTEEDTTRFGPSSAHADVYHKFQNEAALTVNLEGSEFTLIFDNVFRVDMTVLKLQLSILDVQAGFQYSGQCWGTWVVGSLRGGGGGGGMPGHK